jgi:fimbrial chaperone protein
MNMKKIGLAVATVLLATQTMAAQVNLSKLRVNFEGGQTSDFLNVLNESDTDKDAFEVSIKRWKQNEKGQDVLEDTTDLTVSPKTMILNPKQTKLVRLIINDMGKARDGYSYRLVLNQLPAKKPQQEQNTVNLLFKISLPVFVLSEQTKPVEKMAVNTTIKKAEKGYVVHMENKDKQHIQIQDAKVGEKEVKISRYALPGVAIELELPDDFKPGKVVEIGTDKGALKVK